MRHGNCIQSFGTRFTALRGRRFAIAFSHSRANRIEAQITCGEQLFRLRIRDDGIGIAPALLEKVRLGHYGLPGMRGRAAEIGAKLDIWSGAGTGTEIDLSIAGSIAHRKGTNRFRERAQ